MDLIPTPSIVSEHVAVYDVKDCKCAPQLVYVVSHVQHSINPTGYLTVLAGGKQLPVPYVPCIRNLEIEIHEKCSAPQPTGATHPNFCPTHAQRTESITRPSHCRNCQQRIGRNQGKLPRDHAVAAPVLLVFLESAVRWHSGRSVC